MMGGTQHAHVHDGWRGWEIGRWGLGDWGVGDWGQGLYSEKIRRYGYPSFTEEWTNYKVTWKVGNPPWGFVW